MSDRIERIRRCLIDALSPETIEIVDESHLHAGHPGARSGRGHYRLQLVSPEFEGLTLIQRHRRVYDALGSLMDSDIHALSIDAKSPSEQ